MVRNKPAPQQLNAAQQQRNHWNLLEGDAGPAGRRGGGGGGGGGEGGGRIEEGEEEEDDDIAILLNDDDDEDDDDDDDDEDFIPRGVNNRRRLHWAQYLVDEGAEDDDAMIHQAAAAPVERRRRQPQQRQQEMDYGSFREVLDDAQFYVKVSMGSGPPEGTKDKDRGVVCYFGSLVLTLVSPANLEELRHVPCSELWVYVSQQEGHSAVYFEWSSASESSPKKGKQRRRSADNFRHCMIAGTLPVALWQGLGTQCNFELRLDAFNDQTSEMTINVYLKKGGVSDKARWGEGMAAVVEHFFGVPLVLYQGEEVLKHDLEELYSAVKVHHAGLCYSKADPQHPSLFPSLRPYQKDAVRWMLYKENYSSAPVAPETNSTAPNANITAPETKSTAPDTNSTTPETKSTAPETNSTALDISTALNTNSTAPETKSTASETSNTLHCLYTEIQTPDGTVLYFNKFAGFLVKEKPLAVVPTPGGILADEMGLGKTVEVLSCMLCHPRPDVPKPEYLEPVTLEEQKPRRRGKAAKRLTGEDIFTLDGMEKETEVDEEEEEAEGGEGKDECQDEAEIKPEAPEEGSIKRSGRKRSLSDAESETSRTEAKKLKVASPTRRRRIKVHLPRKKRKERETDDEEEEEGGGGGGGGGEVTRSTRPRRNATKLFNGYEMTSEDSDDKKDEDGDEYKVEEDHPEEDEEDEEYRVKTRRRRSRDKPVRTETSPQHLTPSQAVEAEINNSSLWSSIEAVIINECWEGSVTAYRREGSHREFRKFLRMRRKDPYYMMSLRECIELRHAADLARYSASEVVNRPTIQGFFNTKVEPKTYFECICGAQDADTGRFRVQCGACGLWQHAECVQYDVRDPYRGTYVCPHCWVNQQPVTSGATLIVTPSSISYQWVNEIMKHVRHKSIRMLVYRGVGAHGYTQPHTLASFDIVITTYETLSRELNYVDLPHSNSQTGRRFRHPKRFMATPSPLPCVEWWRVCLDEAQMVECTTTKTAEMALRLAAVNRWCVTGTPVQKTVNELQGLLMFLGVDPYCSPQWWTRCLYTPYCRGVKEPLHSLMAQHMWRNSKNDVINQINIPQQSEEVHWLSFTRVEEHFYQSLLTQCSYDAQNRLKSYRDNSVKLSSLDRSTLTSLLQPLLKLRQACNHPQVVRGQFLPLARKTMTMEMLLDNLIKKTKLEAEEAHRLHIASTNGLAAVHVIRRELVEAVEVYREALRAMEEHKDIKTDSLQRLHTLHNLADVIGQVKEGLVPTLRDEGLMEEAEEIRRKYLQQHPQQVECAREECASNTAAVKEADGGSLNRSNRSSGWWVAALQSFDNEFVLEVRDELLSSYSRFEEHKCLLQPVTTRTHLQLVLNAEMKKLYQQRQDMMQAMAQLHTVDRQTLLTGAIDCHLRPAQQEPPQCLLCAVHQLFEEYEETLFSMRETKHSRTTEVSRETQDVKDQAQVMMATRRGHWGQSEVERVLRYLQTKSLARVDTEVHSLSQAHFRMLEAMKREFKNYRIWWRAVFDSVSALDEVNMATIRLRLRHPDEEPPPPPSGRGRRRDKEELEQKQEVVRYILDASELPQQEVKLKAERVVAANDLKAKLGQLLYLQNIAKTDFARQGGHNPEPCPICQAELGEKWAVLMCGHSYCMYCVRALATKAASTGGGRAAIKCPVCRQPTRAREVAYVDVLAKAEEEEVKVQGSLSTKMQGVVRLMLKLRQRDPNAKVLIFSSWVDVLDVIADALAQNGITYRALHQCRAKFHRHLSNFKTNSQITALLLPISSGANGLNIVEARHVVLVEPILNPAAELQAIGRVHRIGQTKETTVHRFIVRRTIEERMYQILHQYCQSPQKLTDENSVTIGDLRDLFRPAEEVQLEKEIERKEREKKKAEEEREKERDLSGGEGSGVTGGVEVKEERDCTGGGGVDGGGVGGEACAGSDENDIIGEMCGVVLRNGDDAWRNSGGDDGGDGDSGGEFSSGGGGGDDDGGDDGDGGGDMSFGDEEK